MARGPVAFDELPFGLLERVDALLPLRDRGALRLTCRYAAALPQVPGGQWRQAVLGLEELGIIDAQVGFTA